MLIALPNIVRKKGNQLHVLLLLNVIQDVSVQRDICEQKMELVYQKNNVIVSNCMKLRNSLTRHLIPKSFMSDLLEVTHTINPFPTLSKTDFIKSYPIK